MSIKTIGPVAATPSLGKYARTERERKFLLSEMPEPLTRASKHIQIWDNYITNTRLRLRKIRIPETKKYVLKLTQKFAPDAEDFSRTIITNTYLNAAEYEVLSIFEGNEIRKNRYPYEFEGRTFGIDVFLGALWGLILAETEFETDAQMNAFALPSFAILDVTNDEMFTGAKLVELTADEIRRELQKRRIEKQGGRMKDEG
jgi:CYTH domain-containing protein